MYSSIQELIKSPILRLIFISICGLLILSIILASISNRLNGYSGWVGFLAVLLIGGILLLLGWFIVNNDPSFETPRWLGWAMLVAAFIRVFAGSFWYYALPVWGYGSPVELSGYIMADAHARDNAAWNLSQSEDPLLSAFRGSQSSDQYGGLLFLSATIYRYLGVEVHQPLVIVTITAMFSALAVLFTWAFARRVFGENVAAVAAGVIVVYPDAIILSSSQMREGYLMTLVAMTCYGLVRFMSERTWIGLGLVLGGFTLVLTFSPPIGGVLLLALLILMLSVDGWQYFRQTKFWLVLVSISIVAGIGIWTTWGRIAPDGITNPAALFGWWLTQSARWQAYFARRSSWLIKRIFNSTPEWSHILILMAYGVFQPFLPAAIMDSGSPIWKGIAIWRAVGWTILLAFLIAAPLMAWIRGNQRKLVIGISLIIWGVTLLAAVRSGGDQWDNPRYRLIFLSLQASLVGWVWVEQLQRNSPWLKRAVISLGIILVWFLPWYLQRYGIIHWPVKDIFGTIGLGLVSVTIFIIGILILERVKKRGDFETNNEL
jgi:hypothetical protein